MPSPSVGHGYNRYLFEYRFDGAEWGIEITAKSPDEARDRLQALNWARYKGQIAARIAVPRTRLLERIVSYFRNLLRAHVGSIGKSRFPTSL
jgi:hypothetical protein